MKKTIKSAVVLISIAAILNSCSTNNDAALTPKSSQQASELTEAQKQAMEAEANKIVNGGASPQKSNMREAFSYEVMGTNITAKNGCSFTLYTFVRAYSLLDATGKSIYNANFCAQPGHLRYAIIYNLNASGTYTSVGSFVGPVGGCLTGGSTYTLNNISGALDTSTQIIIFDVNMSNSSVSTAVYGCFSNPRHLDCNGPSY